MAAGLAGRVGVLGLAVAAVLAFATPQTARGASAPAGTPGALAGEPGEPLLGVPGLAGLISDRAALTLDPAYWAQFVHNALTTGTFVLPKPVDAVKVEQVLPTAPVVNGGSVYPLARKPVDLRELTYTWQGRTKTLAEYMRTSETDVTAFVHNGAIVSDLYENGWSAGVRHQPWSVTKSFVSALVGIAVGEGRVGSLQDPIERYIPDLASTNWKGTTLQNLLEMESGIHWDEGTPVLIVNTQVEQWIQIILDYFTDGLLGQTRNEFLASLPRVAPQGTKFSYNSGNTQVLAWMLERVYGKPFNEIISEKLWKPIGMAGDARVMTDRLGNAIASQGLYSRTFDLARFGELFRNGGRTPDGRQVVPAAWVRESTTMNSISRGEYAYQWWSGPTPGAYEASGFQGQKISVAPDRCLTGVRLSHTLGLTLQPAFTIEAGGGEWGAVYRAVTARLGGCSPAAAGTTPRLRAVRFGGSKRMSRKHALKRRALRVKIGTGGVRARLSITATARVRRAGKVRTLKAAARRLTFRAGPARTVTVPLTKAGVRLLRARRSLRMRVKVVAVGTDGTRRSASRSILLRN